MVRRRRKAAKTVSPRSLERRVQDAIDDALADSFPASDPISFLQASPIRTGDQELSTVKINDGRASRRAGPRNRSARPRRS